MKETNAAGQFVQACIFRAMGGVSSRLLRDRGYERVASHYSVSLQSVGYCSASAQIASARLLR